MKSKEIETRFGARKNVIRDRVMDESLVGHYHRERFESGQNVHHCSLRKSDDTQLKLNALLSIIAGISNVPGNLGDFSGINLVCFCEEV